MKHQLEEAQERNQQFLQTLKDTEDKLAMEEHASVRVKKQLETIKKGEKQALCKVQEACLAPEPRYERSSGATERSS